MSEDSKLEEGPRPFPTWGATRVRISPNTLDVWRRLALVEEPEAEDEVTDPQARPGRQKESASA